MLSGTQRSATNAKSQGLTQQRLIMYIGRRAKHDTEVLPRSLHSEVDWWTNTRCRNPHECSERARRRQPFTDAW